MGRRRKAEDKPLTDCETLEEYRRVMAELRGTKLASEGGSFSVNIGAQDPSASKMPDEDSLRALFGAFRHIWMDDEPASFLNTCQVLHRSNLTNEEREALAKCRDLWKDVTRNDPIKINFNGELLRPRRLIELYFNSVYFHRDTDKRETREALEAAMGPAFGRSLVLQSVNNLMQAAAYVEQIVKDLLEREAGGGPGGHPYRSCGSESP